MAPATKSGADLTVGDVIAVWWAPNRDTIVALTPYSGPLAECAGARIAEFALMRSGMTIFPGDAFEIIASVADQPTR